MKSTGNLSLAFLRKGDFFGIADVFGHLSVPAGCGEEIHVHDSFSVLHLKD